MYIPKHFEITETEKIDNFIDANSFGQLVSIHEDSLVVSHLPFLFESEDRKLLCHLAKSNPQWRSISGQKVLVTLQGDHAYVSPSWYETAGVPTWNYQAVHVEGVAQTFTDPERLKQVVDTLTAHSESSYPIPWEPDYAATMLRGIVGVEIAITSIQCKYKISQNRSARDQENVRQQLESAGHKQLAAAMTKEDN